MKENKSKNEWIYKKIPSKEKLKVQYAGKEGIIAIGTQDFVGKFKLYEVDNGNKSLLLLGKNDSIFALEDKFLAISKSEDGFLVKKTGKK